MKLSSLRYLVAFADEGSFSRAAERCKGHVALTDLGWQVVAQARRALDETRRIEQVAQLGKDPLHGDLRLGVIHTIGPYLLPELIGAMRKIAPDTHLYIEETMTALLADYLKYGTVDAAIVALPFEAPEPSRRVALAWRQGFTRPQAIKAIVEAVGMIENPSYRHIS